MFPIILKHRICVKELLKMNQKPYNMFLITLRHKKCAVGIDPWSLYDVPYQLKKEKMCDKAVKDDHYSLQFVPGFSQGSG